MCFEVSTVSQSDANAEATSTSSVTLEASSSIGKTSNNPAELGVLNECLQELLDGGLLCIG